MRQNLADLSEKDLLNKLQDHYTQINKYRGAYIQPVFDEVGFIKSSEGNDFLVGTTTNFKVDNTSSASCSSWTFAVLLENEKLTNIAFEIEAFSSEEHITDYRPSIEAKTIKTANSLKSQIPAKSDIRITHHQNKEHPFVSFQCPKFYNVADRRKIIELLIKNTPERQNNKSQKARYRHCDTLMPEDMIKICNDFIFPTKKDIEAAQAYRHYLRFRKISAQRQAINEIGGSSPKPRHPLIKSWLNLRSKWIVRNK